MGAGENKHGSESGQGNGGEMAEYTLGSAHLLCLIYCSAGNDSNVTRRMKCWKNDNVNMAVTSRTRWMQIE